MIDANWNSEDIVSIYPAAVTHIRWMETSGIDIRCQMLTWWSMWNWYWPYVREGVYASPMLNQVEHTWCQHQELITHLLKSILITNTKFGWVATGFSSWFLATQPFIVIAYVQNFLSNVNSFPYVNHFTLNVPTLGCNWIGRLHELNPIKSCLILTTFYTPYIRIAAHIWSIYAFI